MTKAFTKITMLLIAGTIMVSCSVQRSSIARGDAGIGIGSGLVNNNKIKKPESKAEMESVLAEETAKSILLESNVLPAKEGVSDATPFIERQIKNSSPILKAIKKYQVISVSKTAIQPAVKSEKKSPSKTMSDGGGWGIASLACGVLGLLFLPILFGPLAIIFGALGLKKKLKGLAIAGMTLGIISLVVIFLIIGVLLAVS